MGAGIGIGVSDVGLLSGSAGYCTVGLTMPSMKSTSTTRSPQTSAVPEAGEGAQQNGDAQPLREHVVELPHLLRGRYKGRWLPIPGDVRPEHGDRAMMPSCTASEKS